MKKYKCNQCSEDFESNKGCKSRQPKFCSRKCHADSTRFIIKCNICKNIIENKHSVSMKNRIYCSRKCLGESRKNIPLSDDWKKALSNGRKSSEKCKGENLYNWKGGKETEQIRMKESFYIRKKLLKEKMPIIFLRKILKLQNNKCFFCNNDLIEYKAIEHLTPISKGGDNHFYNLVYSCKSCNSKKRQQTLEEYSINTGNIQWIDKWENLLIEAL